MDVKSDLLKEAIADAKAVKETALANAKIALEEAFAPRIQSMLSTKISEEMDDEDKMATEAPVDEHDVMYEPMDEPMGDDMAEPEMDVDMDMGGEEADMSMEDMSMEGL